MSPRQKSRKAKAIVKKQAEKDKKKKIENDRKKTKKTTIMDYFFKTYCEIGNHLSNREFLYECLKKFLIPFNIKIGIREFNSHATRFFGDIRFSNTYSIIYGFRLNEEGRKMFGDPNRCNWETKEENVTHKKACILMSCKPGREQLQDIYNALDDKAKEKVDLNNALENYKKIEKILFKKNVFRINRVKIALALYLSSQEIPLEEFCKSCKASFSSVRALKKLITMQKKTKIRLNEEGRKRLSDPNLCNWNVNKEHVSHKEACILMSCKPGTEKLEDIYNALDDKAKEKVDLHKAKENYIKIEEALFKKNIYRANKAKIAIAFYLSSENVSLEKFCKACNVSDVTGRRLKKMLEIDKKNKINQFVCNN